MAAVGRTHHVLHTNLHIVLISITAESGKGHEGALGPTLKVWPKHCRTMRFAQYTLCNGSAVCCASCSATPKMECFEENNMAQAVRNLKQKSPVRQWAQQGQLQFAQVCVECQVCSEASQTRRAAKKRGAQRRKTAAVVWHDGGGFAPCRRLGRFSQDLWSSPRYA